MSQFPAFKSGRTGGTTTTMNKAELLQRIDDGQTNFEKVNFSGQNLDGVEINGLMMRGANFDDASLREAKVIELQLSYTSFQRAVLEEATFQSCAMVGTDLYQARCRAARFIGGFLDCSCLVSADLRGAMIYGTDWSEVLLGFTNLGGAVLGDISNLEQVKIAELPMEIQEATGVKLAPIEVDLATLERTASFQRLLMQKEVGLSSSIPVVFDFFRRIGLNPAFIQAYRSMLEMADQSLQSVFISYSSQDQGFADKLYDALKGRGINVWYAPRSMKGGQKILDQVRSAIQSHDRVLLVLSASSIASDWVSTEIERAYAREVAEGNRVLFPISLVEYSSLSTWEFFDADRGTDLARYIRQFFIPDFSNWKSDEVFRESVTKLVSDLRLDEVPS
jgi:Uncharacterized low-complexity proteins